MQILSKHITNTGGLSFIWEDHDGYQIAGFSIDQVRKFLYSEGLISNRADNLVYVKRRTVFSGTTHYWADYTKFLECKLESPTFCEKILSTNTLLK